MALSDIVLKAKVNTALIRDSRVGALDVGVRCEDGVVTLTGDVDEMRECRAAEEVARSVDGVREVRNEITCGVGLGADKAEMVTNRLLDKLADEWDRLPNRSAVAEAEYVRWALWLVYKFHMPSKMKGDRDEYVARATEEAIDRIAGYVKAPRVLVALEMIRQAEQIAESPQREAPTVAGIPAVATPVVTEPTEQAA